MITPFGSYALVRPTTAPTKIGNIHLPDSGDKPKPSVLQGEVLAVGAYYKGPGVGKHVYFTRMDAFPVNIDNEDCYFVSQQGLLGSTQ